MFDVLHFREVSKISIALSTTFQKTTVLCWDDPQTLRILSMKKCVLMFSVASRICKYLSLPHQFPKGKLPTG